MVAVIVLGTGQPYAVQGVVGDPAGKGSVYTCAAFTLASAGYLGSAK